ncbi:MAG: YoaK family protein [Rhodococcus sp. (in: high G+C Gram-positive bacteria)]
MLLFLSFGAGATDAFAFLALGGIFTANMTGNLVLVGLVGREDYVHTLIGASVAIAVFFMVLFAGFRSAYRDGASAARTTMWMLGVAASMQCAAVAGWWTLGGPTDTVLVGGLISLSAAAMALQTVVARTSTVGGGLSTTFVTGTLVNIVDDLARGDHRYLVLRMGAIVALVIGAFVGALAILVAPALGPVVPAVMGCAAFAISVGAVRRLRHTQ